MKFITLANLEQAITKLRNLFVAKEAGKGLSEYDLSADLKSKYDAAHTHSESSHAPSDAQENVIESVKVNGSALSVTGKAIDVTVPTKTSQITNDSDFQTASQVSGSISAALGSYSNTTEMNVAIASAVGSAGHLNRLIVTELPPVASADEDTIYLVKKSGDDTADNTYTEYMIIDNAWEIIGDTRVNLTGYLKESDIEEVTAEEIDALFA